MNYGIGIGQIAAPFMYAPDLAPVGSKLTYYPRSIAKDARALNFLGFLSDGDFAAVNDTRGSISTDQAAGIGGWDPRFRRAVTAFQLSRGITNDGWIGPQTRTHLLAAVAAKNANPGQPLPTIPPLLPVIPGGVPVPVKPAPGLQPVAAVEEDNTLLYVGGAVGVAALGGLLYFATR